MVAEKAGRSVPVSIFLLCYNQEVMLPKSYAWYRSQFPDASIYVMDNYSTDRSAALAKALGATVIRWGSQEKSVEFRAPSTRSTRIEERSPHDYIWKQYAPHGTWVITVDMDELLCCNQELLTDLDAGRVTVLGTYGVDMLGNSNRSDLSDLDLDHVAYGRSSWWFSKRVAFKVGRNTTDPANAGIEDIRCGQGCHWREMSGHVRLSRHEYRLHHFGDLGVSNSLRKFEMYQQRFYVNRSRGTRGRGVYYLDFTSRERVLQRFRELQQLALPVPTLGSCRRRGTRQMRDPSLDVAGQPVTRAAKSVRAILGPAAPPDVYLWPPPPPMPPTPPPNQDDLMKQLGLRGRHVDQRGKSRAELIKLSMRWGSVRPNNKEIPSVEEWSARHMAFEGWNRVGFGLWTAVKRRLR